MREELNWAERDQLKLTVTIAMEGYRRWLGRFIKLPDEVARFLYGSGENPVNGGDTCGPRSGWGRAMTFLKRSILGPTSVSRILGN